MESYYDENWKEHKKPEGVQPVWRISGYALIKDGKKILMVKPNISKQWELPGGGIHVNETIEEGTKRECWEETGYKVAVEGKPAYLEERNFYSTLKDRFYRAVILVFYGKIEDPTQHKEVINFINNGEIGAVQWVEIDKLKKEEFHPIVWQVVESELKK
jgi:8-oxo-dGTP pyrophosphatase MutT (NUDIX family)